VKAQFGAVAGLYSSDQLSSLYRFARRQRRADGFIARKHPAGMCDRQHIPVDDEADEVHYPVRRGVDRAGRGDIDAAMPGGILRSRCEKRPKDLVGSAHGPRPPRLRGGGGRGRRVGGKHQAEQQRETEHPLIVANTRRPHSRTAQISQNRPEMRPVGERCYPYRSIQTFWMTTRARNSGNVVQTTRNAHIHSVHSIAH
jgi:hypothetical protein